MNAKLGQKSREDKLIYASFFLCFAENGIKEKVAFGE
jgi:hypothetical protein